uniref:MYND-type domain-containing protein n=1 Tax=Globisporangium ultimum (strain ATCC 200006 / CBS 805.95 / DAOM BR144) TaxID=431595 RepID=K3WVF2_GLOUD
MATVVVVQPADATSTSGDYSGDRGRCVVLDPETHPEGVEPGDLVLQTPPFAKLLHPDLWSSQCHHCFAPAAKLSRCGRCRTAYYCSRACQQKDWKPDHHVECRQLEQIVSLRLQSTQVSDMLLLGRVMRRLNAGQSAGSAEQGVLPTDLVWNEADFCQETLLLATLAQKLKLIDESYSSRELQMMLSRFANNNFSICDDLLLEIGAGCFPLGAMVNNSCDPNCAITFTATAHTMEFRAMRRVVPEEEITQSYVDIALPRHERQRRLESKYHFRCKCPRCIAPMEDPQSLDANLDADINGIPESQWNEYRMKEFETAAALLTNPMVAGKNNDEKRATLLRALEIQQRILHPEHISILQTCSTLFSAEMEDGRMDEAILYGERMLEFYRRVYPANHPLTGLHLFTLGDLHLQQQETQGNPRRAKEYLEEAKRILQITHGRAHHFVELLSQRIQAC